MVHEGETLEHRQLEDQILKAEQNERCVRRAIVKIVMLMALSFFAALYTMVIMPELILETNQSFRKVFEVLALGSIMTLLTYVAFWFYYRALLFQVHTECRRFIMSLSSRGPFLHRSQEEPDGESEMILTERAA